MRYLLACLALTIVGPTWAHDADPHYNRISLTASASNEVQQDELQAGLYAMHEDKNARTSANAVSTRIEKALEFLKQEKGISVQTGSFNTQPVYNKQQIVGWRSRQSITVKSTDATRLSDLLGKLQEHVQIEHIGYGVSDEGRAKAEDQLIRLAIGNFNARARLVSGEMGSRDYRLVNMNVSTSQQGPIIHRTMAMMERADANVAPPIKAGTQNIQVTIQGSIELQLK